VRPLLLLALALAACHASLPSPASDAGPLPAPPPPGYYEVPGPVPRTLLEKTVHRTRWATTTRVLLPSRLPAALGDLSHAGDPIEIFVHRPSPPGGRRPLVVMSPVLANSALLMNEFASAFTRQGWIAAVVMRKEYDFDPDRAVEDAEGEFRSYVLQGRQALDWLLTQGDVDPRRVATFGVSAGAVIGACAAAADPRPVAHVFVLAGGPVADVLFETQEERFAGYRRRLAWAGRDLTAARDRLRSALRTDPIVLAPRVDPSEVLLFVARRDTSIPTRYGLRLWDALRRPALVLLPFGHKTSFVLLGGIARTAVRFIGARFDAVASDPPRGGGGTRREPARPPNGG
jgi:dienelactone hydrolase